MREKLLALLGALTMLGCSDLEPSDEPPSAARGSHCALDADTQQTQCFASLQESVAYATHGLVADATHLEDAAERIASLPREKRGGALGAGSSVLAILYEHKNYEGATFIFFGTRCEGQVPRLEDYGMGDEVTSHKVFQGCAITLWEHVRFGGLRWTTTTNGKHYGDFSDAVSSARVHYPHEQQTSL